MTQDLSTILELLLPLTQEVMNPEGLRVLGQGEEPQEERVLGQGEEPMLLQLKGVAQYLANAHSLQVRYSVWCHGNHATWPRQQKADLVLFTIFPYI